MNTSEKCSNCKSLCLGIFSELEPNSLESVSNLKTTNVYTKGQNLFSQGAAPSGIFCIKDGLVKVTQIDEEGKESIVRIAQGGDTVGHRSLFSDENYKATVTAINEVKVCFYDGDYIKNLLTSEPTVAYKLINKLGKDLGSAEQKISAFSQKTVKDRLMFFLHEMAKNYGEEQEDSIKLNIKLTREELASIVGTAPESLMRTISALKKENALWEENKTIYLNKN